MTTKLRPMETPLSRIAANMSRRARKLLQPAMLAAVVTAVCYVPDSEASPKWDDGWGGAQCAALETLSRRQLFTLADAYRAGRQYGYGLSLAAIAWQESLAGEIKINYADPSFGIFHANIKTVASREGVTNGFVKNKLAQRLIDDPAYAVKHAVAELDYWHSQYGDNWMRIWASYNGGWNWDSRQAQNYAESIRRKVKTLNTCAFAA